MFRNWRVFVVTVAICLLTCVSAVCEGENFVSGGIKVAQEASPFYYEVSASGNVTITGVDKALISGKVVIPSAIEEKPVMAIGARAFNDCDAIESVEIGAGLLTIGYEAFSDCDGMTSLYVPQSVTGINSYAFSACDKLESIELACGAKIDYHAFSDSKALKTVKMPDSAAPERNDSNIFEGSAPFALTVTYKSGSISNEYVRNAPVKSIVIEEGITGIGVNAFCNCKSLEEVDFADGIKTIGESAFNGCAALKALTLPTELTSIGNQTFSGCVAMTSVTFNEGLKSIGYKGFYNCDALESVELKAGLLTIGTEAFSDCDGMTSLYVPESVTGISSCAFSACDKLENIEIACGARIDYRAFSYSKALKTVKMADSATPAMDNSNIFEGSAPFALTVTFKSGNISNEYVRNAPVKSIIIEEGVTGIGKNAFCNCGSLEEADFADSIKTIGESAFNGCLALKALTLPTELTSIGNQAFCGCVAISNVTFNEGLKSIGYQSFYNCDALERVELKTGLLTMGNEAFLDCDGMTSVYIPESVTEIGDKAFSACDSLESIEIKCAARINSRAFSDSKALKTVKMADSATPVRNDSNIFQGSAPFALTVTYKSGSISNEYVRNAPVKSITIEEGITGIGANAFFNCGSLEEVDFADSIKTIGESAFNGCLALKTLTLPTELTSIGNQTFSGCVAMTSVTFNEGLKSIGYKGFYNCDALESAELKAGLLTIENEAFSDCDGMTSLYIPDSVTGINSYAFNSCAKLENIEIAGGAVIGSRAFSGNESLKTVSIADSIQFSNGDRTEAFKDCNPFTLTVTLKNGSAISSCKGAPVKTLIIGEGIENILQSAFLNCASLEEIYFPSTLKSIGQDAFNGCLALKKLSLPENLKSIGYRAFNGCGKLEVIEFNKKLEKIDAYAFGDCDSLKGVTIPGCVTSMGEGVFGSCDSLTEITIPRDVSSIAAGMFNYCGKLTQVIIPSWVTSVGSRAFGDCGALEKVEIAGGARIGKCAFESCTALKTVTMPDDIMPDSGNQTNIFRNCGQFTLNVTYSSGTVTEDYVRGAPVKTVYIEEGITRISPYAFLNCASLEQAELPLTLEKIDSQAFYGCDALSILELSFNVNAISDNFISNPQNVIFVVYPDSYAEEWVADREYQLVYASATGVSLIVSLPEGSDLTSYAGFSLIVTRNDSRVGALSISDAYAYKFMGLEQGKGYSFYIRNKNGEEVARVDGITLDKDENAASFERLPVLRDVTLNVLDDAGNDVTGKATVTWYDGDGLPESAGKTLKGALAGKDVQAVVTLSEELAVKYIIPERVKHTVTEDDNDISVRLVPFGKRTLSGAIINQSTNEPVAGATVLVSQRLNGKYFVNYTSKSGADGSFEVEVIDEAHTVAVSADEYLTYSFAREGFDAGEALGELRLTPIEGIDITLNISYGFSAYEGESAVSGADYVDWKDLRFELYNITTNTPISDFETRDSKITIVNGANTGDEVRVKVKSAKGDFANGETAVTVGSDEANISLVQRGGLAVSFAQSEAKACTALIYDQRGVLVRSSDFVNKRATFAGLSSGAYTVVAMEKSGFFGQQQNLSGYDKIKLESGKDYATATANVSDGIIRKIDIPVIPMLDASNFTFTKESSFTANKTSLSVGSYLTLRAQAEFDPAYINDISDARWIFVLDEDCNLLDGTVSVGGSVVSYATDGNEVRVDADPSLTIRMCLQPLSAGERVVNAYVEFSLSGRTVRQPVGFARFDVEDLSFSLAEKTGTIVNGVSGRAPSKANIYLYVNDAMVGQTRASANGWWTMNFSLPDPYPYRWYDVRIEAELMSGTRIISGTKEILYNETAIDPYKVTMINVAHPATSLRLCEYITEFNFLEPSKGSMVYWYWPSYPEFTFIAEFTDNDPERIKDVYVNVKTAQGATISLKAIYSAEKGKWIANGNFDSNNLPSQVGLSYYCDFKMNRLSFEDVLQVVIGDGETDDMVLSGQTDVEVAPDYHSYSIKYTQDDFTLDYAFNAESITSEEYALMEDSGEYTPDRDGTLGTMLIKDGYTDKQSVYTMVSKDLLCRYTLTIENEELAQTQKIMRGMAKSVEKDEGDEFSFGDVPDALETLGKRLEQVDKITDGALMKNKTIKGFVEKTQDAKFMKKLGNAASVLDYGFDIGRTTMKEVELAENIRYSNCLTDEQRNILNAQTKLWAAFNPAVKLAEGTIMPMISVTWFINKITDDAYDDLIERLPDDSILDDIAKKLFDNSVKKVNRALLGGFTDYVQGIFDNYAAIPEMIDDSRAMMENACIDHVKPMPDVNPNAGTATSVLDPSGYVYEAVASNRLQGVTATCYQKVVSEDIYGDEYEEIVLWDAGEYEQINPQITDVNGSYAWDVPMGTWQVRYELDGYEKANSDWLTVPPPRFDVNVGMVSYVQPTVKSVAAYADSVEATFSKYMKTSSVSTDVIYVAQNGTAVPGTLQWIDGEVNPLDKNEIFASRVRFTPDEPFKSIEGLTLEVTPFAKSYADVPIKSAVSIPLEIELKPVKLDAPEIVEIDYLGNKSVTVSVLPKEAAPGLKVGVAAQTGVLFDVSSENVTLDRNGEAEISVNGLMTGSSEIVFTLEGTDLVASTKVTVLLPKQTPLSVIKPKADPESGTELLPGQYVELSCDTKGANIYYTLDGTCPCLEDTRLSYKAPILITKSSTILAMAEKDGYEDSAVSQFEYTVTKIKGDIDGDDALTADDAFMLMKYIAGSATLSDDGKILADMDYDGETTNRDVVLMLMNVL